MSTETRFRSDSIVSVDETDFQLEDRSVLSEDVVFALQSDDVASLRLVDAAELRKPTTAKTYALHEACEHGAFDAVKFLVGELAHDVDARDEQRWTPLHYAAAFGGAPELVHYLLAAGADPSAEDEDGATPLETYLDENESDDPTALLLRSVAEHVEAAEDRDYETWAQAHARDATYGAYVAASRPKYVRDATRHAYLLLRANAMRQHDDASLGASPEAFLLGAHGGHAVVDTVLSFLA
ncbi:protein phosphatase 1 regulatory subunit [Aureococcus anophagefferens]|uniref:Protein phosphatase 1 regulatory subunit n=1 Tax=Aureococcus anophagefferens TaxID=44056 RepID=A0ABR1G7U4_AURAN